MVSGASVRTCIRRADAVGRVGIDGFERAPSVRCGRSGERVAAVLVVKRAKHHRVAGYWQIPRRGCRRPLNSTNTESSNNSSTSKFATRKSSAGTDVETSTRGDMYCSGSSRCSPLPSARRARWTKRQRALRATGSPSDNRRQMPPERGTTMTWCRSRVGTRCEFARSPQELGWPKRNGHAAFCQSKPARKPGPLIEDCCVWKRANGRDVAERRRFPTLTPGVRAPPCRQARGIQSRARCPRRARAASRRRSS